MTGNQLGSNWSWPALRARRPRHFLRFLSRLRGPRLPGQGLPRMTARCHGPVMSRKHGRIPEGRMILRASTAIATLALATIAVAPAHADVLEIGAGGEARWLSGPNVLQVETTDIALRVAAPLAEVPAEAAVVPDYAVADAAQHA